MQGENLAHNRKPVALLEKLAAAKGHMPAQLAVAWLLSRGKDIVPLDGMSRRARVAENLQALDIAFTAEELDSLNRVFSLEAIIGDRYPAMVMSLAAR